jgi:hypothetical protein
MTRRNDKRNNRRNRQRNNTPELPPFAQMLFGAIVGKGVDMIAKKMAEIAEEETPDIHAEGISNQDVTNINNGKATLSKLRIPADGSAVEYHIPDNLQFFFAEDGKLMVRKKIDGDAKAHDAEEGNPITYDDICKALFFKNKIYWAYKDGIDSDMASPSNYKDVDNCTSEAQVKRLIAFNKLQNIAKYLNDGWKPDFKAGTYNWYIIKKRDGRYGAMLISSENDGIVYFKSKYLANEAIRLMGEESLNDLFSTDW